MNLTKILVIASALVASSQAMAHPYMTTDWYGTWSCKMDGRPAAIRITPSGGAPGINTHIRINDNHSGYIIAFERAKNGNDVASNDLKNELAFSVNDTEYLLMIANGNHALAAGYSRWHETAFPLSCVRDNGAEFESQSVNFSGNGSGLPESSPYPYGTLTPPSAPNPQLPPQLTPPPLPTIPLVTYAFRCETSYGKTQGFNRPFVGAKSCWAVAEGDPNLDPCKTEVIQSCLNEVDSSPLSHKPEYRKQCTFSVSCTKY